MSQNEFNKIVESYKGVLTEKEVREHLEELAYLR